MVVCLMLRTFRRTVFHHTGASPRDENQGHERERSVERAPPPRRSSYQVQDLLSITVLAV
jgi:hypothetical protein